MASSQAASPGAAGRRPPLWDAMAGAMLAHYEGAAQAPDGEWMARLKLVLAAPAIRGEYLKINSEMQEALAEAIAARIGTDLEQDMYPRILAGARAARYGLLRDASRRVNEEEFQVPAGPAD